MEIILNKAVAAVTRTEVITVTPATPETFDLIGLSAAQMAAVTCLLAVCAGSATGVQSLYNAAYTALGVDNDDMPETHELVKANRLTLSREVVERLLSKR